MKQAVVIIALLVGTCVAQNLIQFQTKTADEEDAGLNFGSINIELENQEGGTCYVPELTNPGNTFQRGATDVFEGNSTLGECDGFTASNNSVVLTVGHAGVDGWLPEYFRS